MLKLVYEYHKLDESQGSVFTIENIMAVHLVGDKLHKFLNDWNLILSKASLKGNTQAAVVA
jgi:hypothetical protein